MNELTTKLLKEDLRGRYPELSAGQLDVLAQTIDLSNASVISEIQREVSRVDSELKSRQADNQRQGELHDPVIEGLEHQKEVLERELSEEIHRITEAQKNELDNLAQQVLYKTSAYLKWLELNGMSKSDAQAYFDSDPDNYADWYGTYAKEGKIDASSYYQKKYEENKALIEKFSNSTRASHITDEERDKILSNLRNQQEFLEKAMYKDVYLSWLKYNGLSSDEAMTYLNFDSDRLLDWLKAFKSYTEEERLGHYQKWYEENGKNIEKFSNSKMNHIQDESVKKGILDNLNREKKVLENAIKACKYEINKPKALPAAPEVKALPPTQEDPTYDEYQSKYGNEKPINMAPVKGKEQTSTMGFSEDKLQKMDKDTLEDQRKFTANKQNEQTEENKKPLKVVKRKALAAKDFLKEKFKKHWTKFVTLAVAGAIAVSTFAFAKGGAEYSSDTSTQDVITETEENQDRLVNYAQEATSSDEASWGDQVFNIDDMGQGDTVYYTSADAASESNQLVANEWNNVTSVEAVNSKTGESIDVTDWTNEDVEALASEGYDTLRTYNNGEYNDWRNLEDTLNNTRTK